MSENQRLKWCKSEGSNHKIDPSRTFPDFTGRMSFLIKLAVLLAFIQPLAHSSTVKIISKNEFFTQTVSGLWFDSYLDAFSSSGSRHYRSLIDSRHVFRACWIISSSCRFVDFFVSWCPKCKELASVMEQITIKPTAAHFQIARVNCELSSGWMKLVKIIDVPGGDGWCSLTDLRYRVRWEHFRFQVISLQHS